MYIGPLASSAGWSLEETGGVLAYFASQGILGERAGTAMRGVLASLQSPSTIAAKTMEQYGISIYDANGNMLSASETADVLQKSLKGLTQEERNAALGRIFGTESLVAANLLYEAGAKTINKWTDEVNESGYAATQAAKRQDNLAGDVEKLGGAMDTALIKTGSAANDVLRQMVQAVTALVDWYGELPGPVQATAMGLGVATAAAALFAGAALTIRTRLIEMKTQLDGVNASFGRTALVGAGAGIALTGVITIVGLLMARQAQAEQQARTYADTLEDGTQRVTRATREAVAAAIVAERSFLWMQKGSSAENAEKLGLSVDTVAAALLGDADAIAEVNGAIERGISGLGSMTDESADAALAAGRLKSGLEEQIGALDRAEEIARQQAEATGESTSVTKTAAEAYVDAAGSVDDLNKELWDLIDTINEANGVGQDAISANIDYKNVLADVDEQIQKARDGVEGYALTLDENTQAGRDNMDMLVELAKAGREAADKQFALTGNTDEYWAALQASRQAVLDRAADLGMNADEAQALADTIASIPTQPEWEAIVDTVEANKSLDAFMKRWNNSSVTVRVQQSLSYAINSGTVGGIPSQTWAGNANGGFYPSVQFFASGAVREDHRAQMVRAGSWRVFGEEETGGESYIPHAQSKRTTAVPVLRQTAGLMGYDIVPKGAGRDSSGLSISVTNNITATAGMNESQLADKVTRKVVEQIERQLG